MYGSTGLAPTQFTPASPYNCLSYVRVWAEPTQLCSEIIQADMFEDDTGSQQQQLNTGSQQQQLTVQVARNPGSFLIKNQRMFNCWVIAVYKQWLLQL